MHKLHFLVIGVSLSAVSSLFAQPNYYAPINATGQLVLTRTTNLSQIAQSIQATSVGTLGPEVKTNSLQLGQPPIVSVITAAANTPTAASLTVSPTNTFGFNSLSHYDQRMSNNGNQWSTEPATPGVAVGNGYILEGIDNAIQIYSTSGTPQLPKVISVNQLFGEMPEIDRSTGIQYVYTTDMRVFWDPDIQRFMVLQWSQASTIDTVGAPLPASTEWLAVSQTSNPTGAWNIYKMNTTDYPANHQCPCVPDYPQIGADQYGLYISSNEFNANSGAPIFNTVLLAISKSQLGSGAVTPNMAKFNIPTSLGFESSLQPAITPPGASYFMANGGVEYFVSSRTGFSVGSSLAVWAMANTSALNTMGASVPAMTLTEIVVPTQQYVYPDVATQKPGSLLYGDGGSFAPIQKLAFLGGLTDSRILSLSYAGGRLYCTVQIEAVDQNGKNVVGGAYFILSPALRGTTVSASVARQGYLLVNGQHILRPVVAVNAQGKGAFVFTLVGPSYFPSAAYLPVNLTTTGTAIQVVGPGSFPEDGFTGYCPGNGSFGCGFGTGTARWGDNSSAVVASDGSIWGVTEYIPNGPIAGFANWGTYMMKIVP